MNEHGLFDTHAHYDHPLFKGKGPELVSELFDRNVINGAVIPAITFESNFNREMFPADNFPQVYFAAGIHPKCATNEAWWDDKKRADFETLAEDPRTVAIKTGLDFYKTKLSDGQKAHQIRFFNYMINLANDRRLPLVLHIRDAAAEAIEVIRQNPLSVEAVAHCYTYDAATAQEMMSVGINRFGIGGMLTRTGMDGLRECVKELPLSAILLETDAPFVKPKDFDGEVNTSENLTEIAGLIAELKGIAVDEVVQAVQKNAMEFYGIQ